MVHQLKVKLAGVTPMVWRRLQVRSATTMAELHEVLQVAMGWENYHLHAFEIGGARYGENGRAETVTLANVAPHEGDRMIYTYDFGDDWHHVIDVEKVLTRPRPSAAYPRCSAGRRACPPEDTGGPWGYADMLKALRARKGPRYREIKEWLPKRWDPEAFDLTTVNAHLVKLAPDG